MPMPPEISAEFKIVTPMFIGDADHSPDSVRPPSVKGALRFWWRALHWSKHYDCNGKNENNRALESLHKQEAKLFGLAAKNNGGGGQGAFLLRVVQPEKTSASRQDFARNSGRQYLGFGLYRMGENIDRNAIQANQTFAVRLIERPNTGLSDDEREGVRDALRAWGLFGGLGARGRRGFGSVALSKLDDKKISYESVDAYRVDAKKLLDTYGKAQDTPPYSAFSKHSQCVCFDNKEDSSEKAHDVLGQAYKDYKTGTVIGQNKLAFGMPLKDYEENLRRASPLFLHVHPIGNAYTASVLHLPAKFHHEARLSKITTDPAAKFLTSASAKPAP